MTYEQIQKISEQHPNGVLAISFTCPHTGAKHRSLMCYDCLMKSRDLASSEDPTWNDPILDGRAVVEAAQNDEQCTFDDVYQR